MEEKEVNYEKNEEVWVIQVMVNGRIWDHEYFILTLIKQKILESSIAEEHSLGLFEAPYKAIMLTREHSEQKSGVRSIRKQGKWGQ